MLYELAETRQIEGEPRRRWFCDGNFDLIVWLLPDESPMGFQLCYHDGTEEKALTWTPERGYAHSRVDTGEDRPARHKMTPILVPDGMFHRDRILELFDTASVRIEPSVRDFVLAKLHEYGNATATV